MKRLGILFLMGYALSGGVADAATYYVSKGGSDSNSCAQAQSTSSPKLTINAGINCLSAGDTLLVRAGTYDEGISSMPSGTSWTNKVRIANYPGETVWLQPLVHLVGNPGAPVRFQSGNQQYIEFDGINMDGRYVGLGTVVFVIDASGEPHHVRVQNAEIIGNTDNTPYSTWGSSGIEIHGGRPTIIGGFEFRNLTVHGAGRPGTTNYDNGYGIYISAPNNLIENCDIYDNKGAGIQVYNDDGASPDNNIIRNNRIHDNTRVGSAPSGDGILVSGSGNQIYNNLVYNISATGGSGLDVYTGNANRLWNNTIYKNASNGILVSSRTSNTDVRNNILYLNTGAALVGGGNGTVTSNNLSDANPQFVKADSGDFRLSATSPAVDAGTALGPVTTDIIGTSRPQGAAYDVGAYEFQSSTSQLSPPSGVRIIN